jgi:hypothetical protein
MGHSETPSPATNSGDSGWSRALSTEPLAQRTARTSIKGWPRWIQFLSSRGAHVFSHPHGTHGNGGWLSTAQRYSRRMDKRVATSLYLYVIEEFQWLQLPPQNLAQRGRRPVEIETESVRSRRAIRFLGPTSQCREGSKARGRERLTLGPAEQWPKAHPWLVPEAMTTGAHSPLSSRARDSKAARGKWAKGRISAQVQGCPFLFSFLFSFLFPIWNIQTNFKFLFWISDF